MQNNAISLSATIAALGWEMAGHGGRDEEFYREMPDKHNASETHDAALEHAKNAARKAMIGPDFGAIKPLDVTRAVVVGGGTMGVGIAYALMRAGIPVILIEEQQAAIERARHNVARLVRDAVSRGLMDDAAVMTFMARIAMQTGYGGLDGCQLAVEAAYEAMDVKKAIFASLDAAMPENAVLATNTSYLDINEIAAATSRPHAVAGLHFFSPAHIMKLMEIVKGAATSQQTLATAFSLAARLGKIPVQAAVCDGFIGNRILARQREIADMVLMDGSVPWEIDEAMVEFGYAMGPYEQQDLAGLDIAWANRKGLASTRDPARRYIPISDRMVEEGRLGRKASVGWYRYPGGGPSVVDPLLEDMITEEARFAKVERRDFSHDEIRRRILAAMINEAAEILHEGIAADCAAIDLVSIHGYGFPRWRGGLMYHARDYGFDRVIGDIEDLSREDPVVWQVSAGLRALAGVEENNGPDRVAERTT